MMMEYEKPQELVDVDFVFEEIEDVLQSWQEDYFESNGKFSRLEDVSALFDFPVGVGRIVACENGTHGYFIILQKETAPTTVTYKDEQGNIIYENTATFWQKIMDSFEENEDWVPLREKGSG